MIIAVLLYSIDRFNLKGENKWYSHYFYYRNIIDYRANPFPLLIFKWCSIYSIKENVLSSYSLPIAQNFKIRFVYAPWLFSSTRTKLQRFPTIFCFNLEKILYTSFPISPIIYSACLFSLWIEIHNDLLKYILEIHWFCVPSCTSCFLLHLHRIILKFLSSKLFLMFHFVLFSYLLKKLPKIDSCPKFCVSRYLSKTNWKPDCLQNCSLKKSLSLGIPKDVLQHPLYYSI